MSSKKEKRLESKKRKLEALLELTAKQEPSCKKLRIIDFEEDDAKAIADDAVDSDKQSNDRKSLSQVELAELRARLRERQQISMQKAKIYLQLEELKVPGLQELQNDVQKPAVIQPIDIQHMLLYAVQGNAASYKPRWCKLVRQPKLNHVVVVVLDSVSCVDLNNYPDAFRYITDNFQMKRNIEVISPSQYGRCFAEELFRVPMSTRKLMMAAREAMNGENGNSFLGNFLISGARPNDPDISASDLNSSLSERSISCLDLLLTEEQMKWDDYPLPLMNSTDLVGYKYSKSSYVIPNDSSPLFAIDCEMVQTKGKYNDLAWVAVVNERLECVYETLVKPKTSVVDYRTRFSGVSAATLQGVTTTLKDVQKQLRSLLPSDAILVGQSFCSDLHALELFHPYVIDTSVIFNLSGNATRKTGLKNLTSELLGRNIQTGRDGHNPREDAVATMELVLKKLKNGLRYGNVLNGWVVGMSEDTSNSAVPVADRRGESNDSNDESEATSNGIDSRKQHFFQRRLASNSQSFFDLVKRSEKTVAVAGFGGGGWAEDDWAEGAEIVAAEDASDKTVAKQAYQAAADHSVVFARLTGVVGELQQQSDKCNRCFERALQDVNKQVKRILKHLSENTLVAVVLSGRSDANHTENGMCFINVT